MSSLNQIVTISIRSGGAVIDYLTRISDYDTIAWHVKIHIGIWRDQNIISYCNFADNHGIRSYPNAIAYRRRAFALATIFHAYRNSRRYITITPYFSLGVYNDRAVMPDKKSFTYFRLCGNMESVFFIQQF